MVDGKKKRHPSDSTNSGENRSRHNSARTPMRENPMTSFEGTEKFKAVSETKVLNEKEFIGCLISFSNL